VDEATLGPKPLRHEIEGQVADVAPVLGGRRIPPWAVIVPAALGAVLLALTWGFAFRDFPDMGEIAFSHIGWKVLLIAAYAPLLAAVTYAYHQRRCRG
jgi:hypothetical protein